MSGLLLNFGSCESADLSHWIGFRYSCIMVADTLRLHTGTIWKFEYFVLINNCNWLYHMIYHIIYCNIQAVHWKQTWTLKCEVTSRHRLYIILIWRWLQVYSHFQMRTRTEFNYKFHKVISLNFTALRACENSSSLRRVHAQLSECSMQYREKTFCTKAWFVDRV